jgi:hypothetical protein
LSLDRVPSGLDWTNFFSRKHSEAEGRREAMKHSKQHKRVVPDAAQRFIAAPLIRDRDATNRSRSRVCAASFSCRVAHGMTAGFTTTRRGFD